jgi:CRP-like cAMP-binding protein
MSTLHELEAISEDAVDGSDDEKERQRQEQQQVHQQNGNEQQELQPQPKEKGSPKSLHALTMTNTSDPIINCLAIPPGQRTKRDLYPLVEFIKGLKFFHVFSAFPETIVHIAARLELEIHHRGAHIFNEGEPGNYFYIILDGEVAITKKKRMHGLTDIVTENVILVQLGCGQYFGENALDNKNGLRTATALAHKKCTLLALHRDDYQMILSRYKEMTLSTVKKLFRSSIFRLWSDEKIDRLARSAVLRTYGPNAEIFTGGTQLSSLMVIKSGIVKLVKAIGKEDYQNVIDTVDKKLSLPEVKSYYKAPTNDTESLLKHQPSSPGKGLTISTNLNFTETTPSKGSPKTGRLTIDSMDSSRQQSPMSRTDDIDDGISLESGFTGASLPSTSTSTTTGKFLTLPPLKSPTKKSNTMVPQSPLSTTSGSRSVKPSPRQMALRNQNSHSNSSPSKSQSGPVSSRSSDSTRTYTRQLDLNNIQEAQTLNHIAFPSPDKSSQTGQWILTRSDLFLASTKPMKIVTLGSNGESVITAVNRETYTKGNSIEFTVAVVMTGQVIGELAILDPDQASALSAVSSTTVEVYCIDADLLIQMGILQDELIMNELMDDWKFRNPPKQEIQKQLKSKYQWEQRKHRIMKNFYNKKSKSKN